MAVVCGQVEVEGVGGLSTSAMGNGQNWNKEHNKMCRSGGL